MTPTIVEGSKEFALFGFSHMHDPNDPYSKTIFGLLDKVWAEVRSKALDHSGINHVVYEADGRIFAGIELLAPPRQDVALEKKTVVFQKYAYFKHIGPYTQLESAYRRIRATAEAAGKQQTHPFMEVYGHWNEDETKLETEIFYNLK